MKLSGILCLLIYVTALQAQIGDTIDIPVIEYRYQQVFNPLHQDQVQIYDSTRLSAYNGRNLTELLKQESHSIVKSYGPASLATVSFRGKSPSHTGLYWNGIYINSPLVGQVDMNSIPVSAIQKLRIYSGNASLATGSGAIGGTLSIENYLSLICWDCSEGSRTQVSISQQVASYGMHGSRLYYQQAVKKNFNIGISGYYETAANNFTYLNTARRVPRVDTMKNSAFDKWGFTAQLQYLPARTKNQRIKDSLNFALWFQSYQRQVPPLMPDMGVERDEMQSDNSLRVALNYRLKVGKYKHDLILGMNSEQTNYFLYFLVPHQKPYEQFYASSSYSTLQVNYELSKVIKYRHHLSWSTRNSIEFAEYAERRMDSYFQALRYTTQLQGAYLYRITRKIHSEAILNYSHYLPGEIQVNGSVGVFYKNRDDEKKVNSDEFTIGLELGRNTHQPTLNDLFWEPGGNPDLETEKSIEFSIPMSYRYGYRSSGLAIYSTLYYSQIDDWILWKPSRYHYWTPSNVRKVKSGGLELRSEWIYKNAYLHSEFRNNYTFSPVLDDTFDGSLQIAYMQLPYIPLHQFQISYKVSLLKPGIGMKYLWRYNGARYVDMPYVGNREILSHYNIHDIQFSYDLKFKRSDMNFLFRIENLWNVNYQSIQWRPMPGRNYALLIQLNLKK